MIKTGTSFICLLTCLWSFQARAAEFSYEALKSLIKERNIVTIEQLLPLLPDEMRRHYVLVYDSRSVHRTTPQCPRIILFSENARFMMAMEGIRTNLDCGAPNSENAYDLELIQYRDQTQTFDFKFIAFDRQGAQPPTIEEQPPKCSNCHRSDLRPNWHSNPLWPGVYGSIDDAMPLDSLEGQNFAKFIQSNRQRGLYQYLLSLSTLTPTSPEGYMPADQKYFYASATPSASNLPARFNFETATVPQVPRMNRKFSYLLGKWNYFRMARLITQNVPNLKDRISIGAALLQCPNLDSFVPANERASLRTTLDKLAAAHNKRVADGYETKIEFVRDNLGSYVDYAPNLDLEGATFAGLHYFLKDKAHMGDWSMAPYFNSFGFNDSISLVDFYAPYGAIAFAKVPELKDLSEQGYRINRPDFCHKLAVYAAML